MDWRVSRGEEVGAIFEHFQGRLYNMYDNLYEKRRLHHGQRGLGLGSKTWDLGVALGPKKFGGSLRGSLLRKHSSSATTKSAMICTPEYVNCDLVHIYTRGIESQRHARREEGQIQ